MSPSTSTSTVFDTCPGANTTVVETAPKSAGEEAVWSDVATSTEIGNADGLVSESVNVAGVVPLSPSATLRSSIETCGRGSSLTIVTVPGVAPSATFTGADSATESVSSFS